MKTANTLFAFFFALVLGLTSNRVQAQQNWQYNADVQVLRSTHGNSFWGGSVAADYRLSKPVSIGLGLEYTYCPYHLDNGWDLYNLNFLPVYLEEKFRLPGNHRVVPYLHLEEGISFNRYDKIDPSVSPDRYPVREKGFYGYSGLGLQLLQTHHSNLYVEIGLKGFRITTNNLDVNPHGLTAKIGVTI
jgi:hypothetical protein